MLRKIVGIVVVAIIALIGGAYIMPQNIHVERAVVIDRPAAVVFPYINSLKRADEWSPWSKIDPNVKMSFEGPDEGVGAKLSWSGNKDVGTGRQAITESVPNRKVASNLEFGGGGPAKAALTLTTTAAGTQVVWTLDIDLGMNPIGRYMGSSIEKGVSADYERGLAKLKTLVESAPAPSAEAPAQPDSAPTTSPKAATS